MDPRLVWENGQRLNEWTRNLATWASSLKLQRKAKMQKMEATHGEQTSERRSPAKPDAPSQSARPAPLPLRLRHHLKIDIAEEDREVFHRRVVLDFADLDDAWLKDDEDVRLFALSVSRLLMEEDLSEKCDCALEIGRPFSDDWDGIVSLWSNHNFDERFDECLDPGMSIEVLKMAMNELEDQNPVKPQWWFDWDNDVGVFTSIA